MGDHHHRTQESAIVHLGSRHTHHATSVLGRASVGSDFSDAVFKRILELCVAHFLTFYMCITRIVM